MAGVNLYGPPEERPSTGSGQHRAIETVDGVRLGVMRGLPLPRVCVTCGSRKRVKREPETVYVVSPVAWIALLFGLSALLAFKVFEAVGLVKTARLEMPRCRPCIASRERTAMLQGPLVIGLVVGLLAGGTLAGNGFPAIGIAVLLLSLVGFSLALRRWGTPTRVKATRIDEDEIVLSGVHPDAVKAISILPVSSPR